MVLRHIRLHAPTRSNLRLNANNRPRPSSVSQRLLYNSTILKDAVRFYYPFAKEIKVKMRFQSNLPALGIQRPSRIPLRESCRSLNLRLINAVDDPRSRAWGSPDFQECSPCPGTPRRIVGPLGTMACLAWGAKDVPRATSSSNRAIQDRVSQAGAKFQFLRQSSPTSLSRRGKFAWSHGSKLDTTQRRGQIQEQSSAPSRLVRDSHARCQAHVLEERGEGEDFPST